MEHLARPGFLFFLLQQNTETSENVFTIVCASLAVCVNHPRRVSVNKVA